MRIVIVPKSTDNPFFDPSGDGCKDQAALLTQSGDREVTCEYIGPGPAADDNDGKIQAQIVMDLITNGTVDALSISVRDSAAMAPAIQMAHDKGIPVVTFDSDAPESLRSAYVGTDNFFFGTQIAKVLKRLKPTGGTYGLITSAESENLQERVRGFIHEMDHEGEIWSQVPGSPADIQGSVFVAMDKMHEFANAPVPPTAIVPVMGAPMRSGTWKQFVDEHRNKNITLVCGDAMPTQLEFLSRRYVRGLVGQLPYEMGAISTQILYDILNGKNVTPGQDIFFTNVLTHILVPLVLPELIVDHNLIGHLNTVGYTLFCFVAAMSIGFAIWVWRSRNVHVVKVAQPSFLVMVALGIFTLNCALIPLSFDDGGDPFSQSAFDGLAMCMSIPWLASLGFTMTFSALFSKTMRVNQIFHSKGGAFTRVRVEAKDVLVPFVLLFTCNVAILALWTALDPLTYVREDLPGTDGWNRVIATYGSCKSQQAGYYLTPLAAINISVLALANYQAYQARMIQSEFAESKYIGMAMASLLQAMLSGIPILFVVRESPQAYYLVLAFMIFVICCAILLLIFVPKIVLADKFANHSETQQKQHIMSVIRSTNEDIKQRGIQSTNNVRRSSFRNLSQFSEVEPMKAVGEMDVSGAGPERHPQSTMASYRSQSGRSDQDASSFFADISTDFEPIASKLPPTKGERLVECSEEDIASTCEENAPVEGPSTSAEVCIEGTQVVPPADIGRIEI
jgi:ABC-type sugar transport system substrate-binding protein